MRTTDLFWVEWEGLRLSLSLLEFGISLDSHTVSICCKKTDCPNAAHPYRRSHFSFSVTSAWLHCPSYSLFADDQFLGMCLKWLYTNAWGCLGLGVAVSFHCSAPSLPTNIVWRWADHEAVKWAESQKMWTPVSCSLAPVGPVLWSLLCCPPEEGTEPDLYLNRVDGAWGSSAQQRNAQVSQDRALCLPLWIRPAYSFLDRLHSDCLYLLSWYAVRGIQWPDVQPGTPCVSWLKYSCHHTHVCPRLWHSVKCMAGAGKPQPRW